MYFVRLFVLAVCFVLWLGCVLCCFRPFNISCILCLPLASVFCLYLWEMMYIFAGQTHSFITKSIKPYEHTN